MLVDVQESVKSELKVEADEKAILPMATEGTTFVQSGTDAFPSMLSLQDLSPAVMDKQKPLVGYFTYGLAIGM